MKRSLWDKRAVTAIQIARNWDELWRDAEQILVTQEPEPQIYTTPAGSQVETPPHTGHGNQPEVETGTPPFDTEQQVETQRHTGHGQQEQQTAEDFVLESRRRDVQGHDDEGGHTQERHIGKSERWLRKRLADNPDMDDASSFNTEANANLTQARFIKKYKKEIDAWLKSKSTNVFNRTITMDREIGIVVPRHGRVRTSKRARVILGKKNSELGYRAVTSYPIP